MRWYPQNPLPGMNPWLEAYWGDIYSSLAIYARDEIQRQLPPDLNALVEEYLAVEHDPEWHPTETRQIVPDISIRQAGTERAEASATTAVLEDAETEVFVFTRLLEPPTLRRIQIIDTSREHQIVTVIEFISPANKTRKGAEHYIRKQQEMIDADVNLVEIDLVRQGHWVVAAHEACYPPALRTPYRICVTRATTKTQSEAYRATFSSPLPQIKIPLRSTDIDVILPLQTLINRAYENGRYGNLINYDISPKFPLKPEDHSWISQCLAQSC